MTFGNTNFRVGCDVVSFVDDLNKIRRFGKKMVKMTFACAEWFISQSFVREIRASRVLRGRSIAPTANETFAL